MKMLKSTFLVFLFIITIFPARSQWIPCQGIEGAFCQSIVKQDSFLFIGASNGIFRRSINATSWDSACFEGGFMGICSTGDALFCFAPQHSSCRSLDNGSTWEELDLDIECENIETVDSIVFIDTYDGLLRSSDNGETWTNLYPTPDSLAVSMIHTQDGIIFCEMESMDSIYRSNDYGDTWTSYPLTGVVGEYVIPYFYNDDLWLAHDNRFYIYDDLLLIWNIMKDSMPTQSHIMDFIEDSGTLYCYTNNGYFIFDNQDSAWIDCSEGLEDRNCMDACRVDNTIYLATTSGPFSKTEGNDWLPEYDDLFGMDVSQVFVGGSRTYALAKGKIYFSDDVANGFEILESQAYCPANQMIITDTAWFAGSDCGFLISVDSGLSWTAQNAGIEGIRIWDITLTDKYYFAELEGYGNGIFRSGVDSNAWERVPNEFGTTSWVGIDAINNVLFAICSSGLYRSTDFGTSFEELPAAGYYGVNLFIKDNKIFQIEEYDSVIYSADLGDTWKTWISDTGNYQLACMDITNTLETTVLGGHSGTWYPINYLSLFTLENPLGTDITGNLPAHHMSYIQNVFFDNGRIFVCPSSGGLWYRDDLMVGIKDDNTKKKEPSGSLLLFPNPVCDFITIDLQGNGDQSGYLIYDQLGRMIKSDLFGKDNSQTTIDVSGLQQGVYFVVIRDDNGGSRAGKFVKAE
jgi:photosystem II stability/assembly factor-like uncharacterized protein